MATISSPITDNESAVLEFLRTFIEEKGYAPTTREIKAYFGHRSQTSAVNYLIALERKGRIKRVPGLARTIAIL